MSQDDLDHIPAIVPTRDSDDHRPSAKSRGSKPDNGRGGGEPPAGRRGGGAAVPAEGSASGRDCLLPWRWWSLR
ncbi:hypothetical protein [Kineobactrum salinum]|uniref:Uncharacterized protein n=1 Tax=Kineobactrum salinum TaxID=2708301 RepID=A0A6C0U141_9GAMM|nr:hypothetical protein [Kineobactrum salinum]QIB64045.1 hypothetical protein G3T16_13880 [Kineobactrum salinum]